MIKIVKIRRYGPCPSHPNFVGKDATMNMLPIASDAQKSFINHFAEMVGDHLWKRFLCRGNPPDAQKGIPEGIIPPRKHNERIKNNEHAGSEFRSSLSKDYTCSVRKIFGGSVSSASISDSYLIIVSP